MDGFRLYTDDGAITIAPDDGGTVRVTINRQLLHEADHIGSHVASIVLTVEDAAAVHDAIKELVVHLAALTDD